MRAILSASLYGVRQFRTQRLHGLCVILIIAAGIGIIATVDNVVRALLFRPLGVGHSEDLYHIYAREPRNSQLLGLSSAAYEVLKLQTDLFDGVIASTDVSAGVSTADHAWIGRVQTVSANYFDALELLPSRGRLFRAIHHSNDVAEPQAVISHSLWQSRFTGSRDILEERLRIEDTVFRIIGVAPAGFSGLTRASFDPTDAWLLHDTAMQLGWEVGSADARSALAVVARIRSEVTVDTIAGRLTTLVNGLKGDESQGLRNRVVLVKADGVVVHPSVDRRLFGLASMCSAVAGLILLAVCASVAGSLLSRTTVRSREIAIRFSLGASRSAVVGQLVAQHLVLVLAGSVLGVAAGLVCARALCAYGPLLFPASFTTPMDIEFGWVEMGVGLTVFGMTGVLAGVLPAVKASYVDVAGHLSHHDVATTAGGAKRFGTLHALIVPQVAVSVLLLVVAAVFAKSVQGDDGMGYEASRGAFVSVDLGLQGYDEQRSRAVYHGVKERLALVSGARVVGVSDWPVVGNGGEIIGLRPVRSVSGSAMSLARVHRVEPGLLETVGIEILDGRDISQADSADRSLVAIVDRRTADRYWPAGAAVGEKVRLDFGETVGGVGQGRIYEIVGVVRNIKDRPVGQQRRDRVYVDFATHFSARMTVHAVGGDSAADMLTRLKAGLREIDAGVIVLSGLTLAEYADRLRLPRQATARIALVVGLVIIFIATLGIFGVMEQSATHRTREIGVRIALGATTVDVVRATMTKVIAMTALGVGLGYLLSRLATSVLSDLLVGVSPLDGTSMLAISVLVLVIGFAGGVMPVVRVIGQGPARALQGI